MYRYNNQLILIETYNIILLECKLKNEFAKQKLYQNKNVLNTVGFCLK